jgi:hypothetical protein
MIIQANQTEMPQNRLNQYVLCLLMVFGIVLAVKCFSEVKKTKVFDLGLHGKILVTAKQIYIESFFQQWVLKTDPKWTIKILQLNPLTLQFVALALLQWPCRLKMT